MPSNPEHKNEITTQTYLARWGGNLLDSLVKRFSNPKKARRNRFILLFGNAILLALLLLPSHNLTIGRYQAGEISTSDIRASEEYLLEDKELTAQLREEAEKNAPSIYTYNHQISADLMDKLDRAVKIASNHKNEQKHNEELKNLLEPVLNLNLSNAELDLLHRLAEKHNLMTELQQTLDRLYNSKIVLDASVFNTDVMHGIELYNTSGKTIGIYNDKTGFIDINQARTLLLETRLASVNREGSKLLLKLTARLLKPNLIFNRDATEARKDSAVNEIKPVLYRLKKGEMVVRVGERISNEQAKKLAMLQQASHGASSFSTAIGYLLLISLLIYLPYRFACINIRKFSTSNKDLLAVSSLLVGSVISYKLAQIIATNIGAAFPTIATESYAYLLPFAAAAMTIRILLNSEVALVYCITLVPLLGLLFNGNIFVVIYALAGSLLGAHSVGQCQNRNTIYVAGLKLALANLGMVLCFQAISNSLISIHTLHVSLFALLGALLSSMLVSAFVPLFETLFHYTTNIKLLELANLNSPLLRELLIKAPGTYHHSVMVGNLVEAAAEAIGANPLLARVSAYYHDVGKTAKPLYFIENMQGGENRHDKLSPHMSALVLISHLKEGEILAREHRLGQLITDIIRQHHGTAMITFFYEKARQQAEAEGLHVEEQEFRYPGPKPQTREAGLVMLADAVEAASRTLVNPTPDRIQGMVQKLINRIFSDGQLDECELTLKNLHEIAKSFNRILAAMFHHRIDYPEPVHKGTNGGKKSNAHNGTEPAAKASGPASQHQEGSGEDLKRLGMS